MAGWARRPPAFTLALPIILVWGPTRPLFNLSDTWQPVINPGTTIVTFPMVFLIQTAQNRDASAIGGDRLACRNALRRGASRA